MRRWTTHALNRSKLWQQDHCQHPQNANPDGSTLEGTAQRIGRPFASGGAEAQGWWHHATTHLRSRLESQHQSVPRGAEECGDPLVQSGGRWQILGVAAGLGTNMTFHNTKASLIAVIRRVFAELPTALVKKACSQFRIRIEAVIEAEDGCIELMSALLHNQVTWTNFFNKCFKAVVLFSLGRQFYRSTLCLPYPSAGYDTRLIFKRSLTGWIQFSFS